MIGKSLLLNHSPSEWFFFIQKEKSRFAAALFRYLKDWIQTILSVVQQHPVRECILSSGLSKQLQELIHSELLFLLALNIQDNPSLVHHDQTVAMADGIIHVMGDHQGCELALVHHLICNIQHLSRCFGVQRGGMLIQQQELRLLHRRHNQCDRLALTAGEQPDLIIQPAFQSQAQHFQRLGELLVFPFGEAPAQSPVLSPPGSQCQVL